MGKRVREVGQERERESERECEGETQMDGQADRQKAGRKTKDKLGRALALPIHLIHIPPSSKLCVANGKAVLISPCHFSDALPCG